MSADFSPKSIGRFACASFLDSAARFKSNRVGGDADEAGIVRYWLADMLTRGMTCGTCTRYLRKIHSIYKGWQLVSSVKSDPFAGIESIYGAGCESGIREAEANLRHLNRLLSRSRESDEWQLVSIFLFLLYDPEASLDNVVSLKFEDARCGVYSCCPQIEELMASRDSSAGRKYVFSLNQSHARKTQILRELNESLRKLAVGVGMRFEEGFSRRDITSLWIARAIDLGIDLRVVRAVLPDVPPRFKALELLDKAFVPEAEKREAIWRVANSINSNATHWFVMKLRPGVTADDIKSRIEETLPGRLDTMDFYYPTHTVVSRQGKKRVRKEVAYVPDLLFFRTQYDKVRSLFAKIGDLAWCYKWSNSSDSGYSIIPQADMTHFQQTVGMFTSDIRVELIDLQTNYKVGDSVLVTGGVMKGYLGEIQAIDDKAGDRIFILRISNDMGLRIIHEVPDVFVESGNGASAAV